VGSTLKAARDERKLRLGVVGLGQAGAMVIDAIKATPDLPWTLVAGADSRSHARERFAAEYGEAYADCEALCRESSVDAVYIASPSSLHREHVEIAALYGKHMICEKPLALTVADGLEMVAAARRAGVILLAGHTHSFDAPVIRISEIVQSGELGPLRAINCWNFNEFNHRPRLLSELASTHGPVLNQGPHHTDIVRQIGGGLVRSVRASTVPDGVTGIEGGYVCFLQFDNGVPATMVYDGRSLFDTAELFEWVGESGGIRDRGCNAARRSEFEALMQKPAGERDESLSRGKESGRYAGATAGQLANAHAGAVPYQPHFGLIVVACERGTLRQSPKGLYLYSARGREELPLQQTESGRIAELIELHEALASGRAPFHDGAWGLATLEVCFGMLESSRTFREIPMKHQVAI
jgi:phthalate 4,5-cis-dihydrodiol dehydrogenase